MNKLCSEGLPAHPPIKDLGVHLVTASFCTPFPDSGITPPPLPAPPPPPPRLPCQVNLLDHQLESSYPSETHSLAS